MITLPCEDNLLQLLDRPIAFHRIFVEVAGTVAGAVWLSQLLYWSSRGRDSQGWIYKTQAEWAEETGLNRSAQEHTRERLRADGILEEELRGIPARLYYRLNVPGLNACLRNALAEKAKKSQFAGNEQTRLQKASGPARQKVATENVGGSQPISEITTQETLQVVVAEERNDSTTVLPMLGFDRFDLTIQCAALKLWERAGLNPNQKIRNDRVNFANAAVLVSAALNLGSSVDKVAAAIDKAKWPSRLGETLSNAISARQAELRRETQERDGAAAYEAQTKVRHSFERLDLADQERLEKAFLSGMSDAFKRRYIANPGALLCRMEFDKWLDSNLRS